MRMTGLPKMYETLMTMALNDDLDVAQCNADWCVRKPGTPTGNLFRPIVCVLTGVLSGPDWLRMALIRGAGRMLFGWARIDVRYR